MKIFIAQIIFLFILVVVGFTMDSVPLDKAYRFCRLHGGLLSIDVNAGNLTCNNGTKKNFFVNR